MFCFGVANSSPEKALAFLEAKGTIKSPSDVTVVPVGRVLSGEKAPKRNVVFIICIADLFRNLKVLNGPLYRDVQVFVFASPLRINELQNCTHLDLDPDVANRGIGFRLAHTLSSVKYKAALKRDPALPVRRDNGQYLTVLTDNVKHGSLLTPLMTFIYTLPRATHQTPVKEALAKFFFGTSVQSALEDELAKFLSEKNLIKVRDLVTSEVARTYRDAFRDYREKIKGGEKINLKSLCNRWNVNDYEMKYVLSVIEGMKNRGHLRGKSMKDIQSKGLKPITTRAKEKQPGVRAASARSKLTSNSTLAQAATNVTVKRASK